jgi:hypothetical protein
MDELPRVAENLHRPIENAVYPRADVLPEVFLDRLGRVAEGCETKLRYVVRLSFRSECSAVSKSGG